MFFEEMMHAILEKNAYREWVERERSKRVPAVDRGATECVRCGWCCARRTCVPTPEEMPAIAEHLGLSVEELVKQYMVGDCMDGHCFVRFANTEQQDVLGEYLSDWRTYDKGDCLLYQNGGCAIYPVRPRDAREQCCWAEDGQGDAHDAIEQWQDGDMESFGVVDGDE